VIAQLLLLATLVAEPATEAAAPAPARSRTAEEDHRDRPGGSRRSSNDPGPTPDGDEEIVRHLELLERKELLEHLELFDASGDAPRAERSR
jgi:hypothetical protein